MANYDETVRNTMIQFINFMVMIDMIPYSS